MGRQLKAILIVLSNGRECYLLSCMHACINPSVEHYSELNKTSSGLLKKETQQECSKCLSLKREDSMELINLLSYLETSYLLH